MSQEIELLTEIRDLLRVMAEPALAERDASLRAALREIVGKSKKKAKAILLMDGSRLQREIRKEANIDQGDLSRFVKKLTAEKLIAIDYGKPRLLLSVPSGFFEDGAG